MCAGLSGTLIGWNVAKWQAWFAWRVRKPSDWMAASLIGAVVLNLVLPVEIGAALRLLGFDAPQSSLGRVWLEALAISAAVLAVVVLARRSSPAELVAEAEATTVDPHGILARAGLREPDQLAGFEAEDHFCRLHLVDGRSVLTHARFGDLLHEVSLWDGAQVHRGSWVRSAAVRGSIRAGRRWMLQTDGGANFAVSARHLPVVRRGRLAAPAFVSGRGRPRLIQRDDLDLMPGDRCRVADLLADQRACQRSDV